ncbi:SDR family oxidoreductase [Chromobacterium violaceum]|uniref:SDR family oxidoreductase n=1 Tax=Chromobacterium violaceum TaxID=536 RepID=UPI0005D33071|nr:SDR family oxidoreductase [Chromobacterium violaceum]KJH68962.1 oxidoreductase [Chromobacterium violaceum]QIY78904.1 SDR family oxidoreductase [Chromobacterium violaceum]
MTQEKIAFVTGATGLLGNNLVRLLLAEGYRVRALARSERKAMEQFGELTGSRLEVVLGDLTDVKGFAPALRGCQVIFHAAAYFRESYKGGRHLDALRKTNVEGTQNLLREAYTAGIRRMVHISSIAVLGRNDSGLTDESMVLAIEEAPDDYYRSKIETDAVIFAFLDNHPDMHISLVLPGWMHGPGDLGPTSAGQFVEDYLRQKIPGVIDAAFSVVDARDVAQVALASSQTGERGERYLAAGHPVSMAGLLQAMEAVSGVPAPRRGLPRALLYAIASLQEIYARLTGKPVLLSLATVKNMANDYGRKFSSEKIRTRFGLGFRPMEETLAEEVAWIRQRMARAGMRQSGKENIGFANGGRR